MPSERRIEADEVQKAIEKMVVDIASRHKHTDPLYIVGIADGGLTLSRRLQAGLEERLGREIPCGIVNITFHRDDIGLKPIPKMFIKTDLPFYLDDSAVILVDDVLFSGRSARAALNELFDQGRPDRVELAVLCDRGNRRLPIQPDYVGLTVETTPRQNVRASLSNTISTADQISIYSE